MIQWSKKSPRCRGCMCSHVAATYESIWTVAVGVLHNQTTTVEIVEEDVKTCADFLPVNFAGLVIGNQCGAQCDTNDCNNGCQRTIPSDVLEKPSAPPVLTPMSDTSLFDVDVPMELEMFEKPSVVFQIEYRPGVFVYHWMVDVIMTSFTEITIADFLLDLTSFPAESRLNVSFAYATEESGLSTFSDPTEIQLSGTCSVSALTETQVSITSDRDTRAGFFNHPVLNVTWCPTSCPEGVQNYTVTRRNCDEEVSETVNSTTSRVLLRSKSPGFFIRPCTVRVEVKTFLANGGTQLVSRTLTLSNANSVVFPELELSCSAAYDREEEKYVLDSQLTAPFSPATLSNIEVFVIRWDSFLKPQQVSVTQQLLHLVYFV
ncbi:hypothetical protein GBAR_LOCUS25467 [Geodia barretti]|uniref:Uncharacterized protein n=1 Tax=Geodia barretti TaxID=519541 RepID=A0AA35TDQ8_GEOBA|nr:hypothetical protein GBAR_LOCUS25467 [Geodia barretti]